MSVALGKAFGPCGSLSPCLYNQVTSKVCFGHPGALQPAGHRKAELGPTILADGTLQGVRAQKRRKETKVKTVLLRRLTVQARRGLRVVVRALPETG